MKLFDYIGKQYVILETAYDAKVVDVENDEDDYNIVLKEKAKPEDLDETIAEILADNSDIPEEEVTIWEGTVASVSGTENVTIYVPASWD